MTSKSIRKNTRKSNKKSFRKRIIKNKRSKKIRSKKNTRKKIKSKSRKIRGRKNIKSKRNRLSKKNLKGGQITEKPVFEEPYVEKPVPEALPQQVVKTGLDEPYVEKPVPEAPPQQVVKTGLDEPYVEKPVPEAPPQQVEEKTGIFSNLFGSREPIQNPIQNPEEELNKLIILINLEIEDGKKDLEDKKKVIINIIRENIGNFENDEMKDNLRKLAEIIDKIDPKVEMSPEEIKEICSQELDYKNNTGKSSSMVNTIIAFAAGLLTCFVIAEGIPLVKTMIAGNDDKKN